ncbi:MAG: bluetail domain-containing putative surface protein [Cyanobacteria bacterium J06643_13]
MITQLGQESNSILDNINNLAPAGGESVGVGLADLGMITQFGSVAALEETSIQAVLNTGTFAPNSTGIFNVDEQIFLAINDGIAGYAANDDAVIEITGIAGEIIKIDPTAVEPPTQPPTQPPSNPGRTSTTINVDSDFGGNLDAAIAAAQDGDTVQLGNNRYFTEGIFLEQDITIDGESNSIIDGGGTSNSILSLSSGATGATIQDLRITNGNNGINSNGAFNLTITNLEIDNIGLDETIRDGQNNTGIILNRADGLQLANTYVHDIGRKGIGINDTDGATVSNLFVQSINLAAEHAQSFDAAGIKFYNTNDVALRGLYMSNINAFNIWNDTTNGTTIEGNTIENLGDAFAVPDFNSNITIGGIYNEKSANSVVRNNRVTAVRDFLGFNSTVFSTQTQVVENNDFSSFELNTTDFWVNEEIEILIAVTEDPDAANFNLFADEFFAQANIG